MTKEAYLEQLLEQLNNWEITGFEYDLLVAQVERLEADASIEEFESIVKGMLS